MSRTVQNRRKKKNRTHYRLCADVGKWLMSMPPIGPVVTIMATLEADVLQEFRIPEYHQEVKANPGIRVPSR